MNREEMQTELDALKRRIAELEAQLKEPEWVPFPGEIVEVRGDDSEWMVRRIDAIEHKRGHRNYLTDRAGLFSYRFVHARPLQDPNVIQLRPHTPGDPMPCDLDRRVIVKRKLGMEIGFARQFIWGTWADEPRYRITAWAPLP